MIKFAIVGLLSLLGTCRGQEALCICVDSKECVNGVASSDAVGRVIDYNTERCSGVRVCCKINERSERSSLRPSPPSYETPANNGPPREYGSQVELVDVPLLPIKNQQTGCGVRRTKDHRKPGDSLNERKGEEIQATTVKPGCEMKSNPNWPKVSKTQFRGINDENPDCKPKPNWPGVTTGQIRIIADEDEPVDTFYGELPWMVRVNVNGQFECGGTLIGHHTVLTAAHCVKGKQAADLTVDAGEWDTSTTKEPQKVQRREVHTVTSHGKFDSETGQHDVALLFTKEPFDFTETVDLICLGEKFQYLNQKDCYVAGWGKPTPKVPNYSTVLRKIPVPVLNNSHCQELFRETEAIGPQFVLLGGFVCVGGLDYKDTCKGDGGGPLFCSTKQDRDRFAVAGIISWGLECGKGYPTVVAGVPFYNKWIDHVSGDWRNNVLPTLGDRTRIY